MQVLRIARGAAARNGVQIGRWSDRQAALAPKTPIDAARPRYAVHLTAQFAFERWGPWDELKAKTVVDHREPARGQGQPPAIDPGNVLSGICRPTGEAGLACKALGDRAKLASAKRVDQIAAERDVAAIAAHQALGGEMIDALVERFADLSAKTAAGQSNRFARYKLPVEPEIGRAHV